MKNLFCNRTIFIVFSFFITFQAMARQGTVVKATVDKTSILIGEPVVIRLEADIPELDPIRFFYSDSIAHFEFLSKEKIDTTNTGRGTRLTQLIRITSFDSGRWVIPPFVLREGVQTDSFHIDVGFTPFNPEQPYHDIKDIIEVETEKKEEQPWWWYLAGGGVLLLILLYFLFRKKKPVVTEAPVVIKDPYKEAMERIAQLEQKQSGTKEYYAELADIFRGYLHEGHQVFSLQQTTNELVGQLKQLKMPEAQFNELAAALRLSDWVKFAKYRPDQAEDRQTLDTIKSAITWLALKKTDAV